MTSQLRQSIVQACNGRFFYGWIIVFVGSFGVFSSGPGQSHTFSVFLDPIGTELGISSASMATA
ncbi:MAG: MFS transporter, partial [Rhizobiales bacterium]|nr:MFS transporter [Hyphomicrobiales bacterium]